MWHSAGCATPPQPGPGARVVWRCASRRQRAASRRPTTHLWQWRHLTQQGGNAGRRVGSVEHYHGLDAACTHAGRLGGVEAWAQSGAAGACKALTPPAGRRARRPAPGAAAAGRPLTCARGGTPHKAARVGAGGGRGHALRLRQLARSNADGGARLLGPPCARMRVRLPHRAACCHRHYHSKQRLHGDVLRGSACCAGGGARCRERWLGAWRARGRGRRGAAGASNCDAGGRDPLGLAGNGTLRPAAAPICSSCWGAAARQVRNGRLRAGAAAKGQAPRAPGTPRHAAALFWAHCGLPTAPLRPSQTDLARAERRSAP